MLLCDGRGGQPCQIWANHKMPVGEGGCAVVAEGNGNTVADRTPKMTVPFAKCDITFGRKTRTLEHEVELVLWKCEHSLGRPSAANLVQRARNSHNLSAVIFRIATSNNSS
jgi:hypothetical protein